MVKMTSMGKFNEALKTLAQLAVERSARSIKSPDGMRAEQVSVP